MVIVPRVEGVAIEDDGSYQSKENFEIEIVSPPLPTSYLEAFPLLGEKEIGEKHPLPSGSPTHTPASSFSAFSAG